MVEEPTPTGDPEPKPKKAKKAKKPAQALDTRARRLLWKPRSNFEEIAERAILVWEKNPSLVKITGLTPAQLQRLLTRSKKSGNKEKDLVRLAKESSDRRLLDGHEAWKGLLDFKAAVVTNARRNLSLKGLFEELLDFMKTGATQVEVVVDTSDDKGDEGKKK